MVVQLCTTYKTDLFSGSPEIIIYRLQTNNFRRRKKHKETVLIIARV